MSISEITLSLKTDQFLYHGSKTLFEAPYIVNNIENRLSTSKVLPMYYATKTLGGENENKGYLYEYRISKHAMDTHGGIPGVIQLTGDHMECMKQFKEMIKNEQVIHRYTANDLSRNGREDGRSNGACNDDDVAAISRTRYNGVCMPKYENQIVICGRDRPVWLEIVTIYSVTKNPDGSKSLTVFKSF